MNQSTATLLWLAGTVGLAFLSMQVPLPQAVRTAMVFFLSACLFWVLFNRVRLSRHDGDPKG